MSEEKQIEKPESKEKRIKLPQKDMAVIGDYVKRMKAIESVMTVYLQGLASGMDFPEGYKFDSKSMEFIIPETRPDENEKA